MITELKKVLSLSSGVLIAIGMNSVCFATETNTASSLLGNLLTTTAEAIAPNQTQTTSATPLPAESTTSADATTLPTFDDPVAGEPAKPATSTTAVVSTSTEAIPATTPQSSAVPQPAASSVTTPVVTQPNTMAVTAVASVPPVVATPSETSVVAVSGQSAPIQVASGASAVSSQPTQVVAEQKKKVGFLSQNGIVFIVYQRDSYRFRYCQHRYFTRKQGGGG